jgi:NTE family protein
VDRGVSPAPAAAGAAEVKCVNLALQGGGSHGAYAWGVLDAFNEDSRIRVEAISGASAGAMNAVVYACGLAEGGRERAREKLEQFWLAVSSEGSLAPAQRKWVEAWIDASGCMANSATQWVGAWARAMTEFASPYAFNPFNVNPLRWRLANAVDFNALNADGGVKLFIAATNVRTGRGEIFRKPLLTVDHIMASACLPQLFQAVEIDGEAYWDGGYAGNPPLWPLFYETGCHDVVIVQINPIERPEIPRTSEDIANRLNEVTFNASLLGELRAADFVARLVRSGVLNSADYRLERLHRIGGAGRLASFGAESKFDVSWPFLRELRALGRADAEAWLKQNFDAIGVESTLDIDEALNRAPPKALGPGAAKRS